MSMADENDRLREINAQMLADVAFHPVAADHLRAGGTTAGKADG